MRLAPLYPRHWLLLRLPVGLLAAALAAWLWQTFHPMPPTRLSITTGGAEGAYHAHPASAKTTGFAPSRPVPLAAEVARQRKHFPDPETTQAIQTSADQFEGKRSLATTRMFLFDMCERMFARRNPALAEQLRDGLNNAKNRESMLAISRDMMVQIEAVAGHQRADSIAERIAMLLPAE